jgi:flagellar motor protein MotB
VDGFIANEIDLERHLAAAGQSWRDDVDNRIMSPLMNAPDGAVLVVQGHADRVDTGEDHRACLKKEHDASRARAVSAVDTILMMLGRDWISPPPTDWDQLPWIAVHASWSGAAMLVDPGDTEQAALRNRRVELSVCRFFPDE